MSDGSNGSNNKCKHIGSVERLRILANLSAHANLSLTGGGECTGLEGSGSKSEDDRLGEFHGVSLDG